MSSTDKALRDFQKDISMSTVINDGSAVGAPLVRQDLEAAIINLSYRNTPFRDMVKRTQGEGRAHAWNTNNGLGALSNPPVGAFYADGALPTQSDPTYAQKVAAYKYLGGTAVITGSAIASSRSYTDLVAEIVGKTMRGVIQAEEWAMFKGSSAQNALEFDGLDRQIVTNTQNALGQPLTDMTFLDIAVKQIRNNGGAPTHVMCSFGQQNTINKILFQDVRIITGDGTTVTAGVHAVNYQSPVGVLPIVGDFFVNPISPYPFNTSSSSSSTGNTQSNIYVLTVPEIEMVMLQGLGRYELAKIADTVRYFISEYVVMAVKAEPWQAIITNVQDIN